jgi:hydroxymethylglutaryl-CoA lyase
MLNGMGVETGIDLGRLAAAGREVMRVLRRKTASKAAAALEAREGAAREESSF